MPRPDIDVAIVGAGISGISMAAHLQMLCPGRTFTVLERRADIGGTWDLFRYPGVRSDSDMHTLGFRFEPWVDEKAIADGDAIRRYLARTVNARGIARHIRFGVTVLKANWDSATCCWRMTISEDGGTREMTARFLYLAAGYYDYDEPHDAQLPGLENFHGRVVHPQFWPADLYYAGKRVVVVGSGATAVTIVPAMAAKAAHVTMLQRTPTWMAAGPSHDRLANALRRLLPARAAHWLTRQKNIRLRDFFFKRARKHPERAARFLTRLLRKDLGGHYDAAAFHPPYDPWTQRVCLVPDGDLFRAIEDGKASIRTARIAGFTHGAVMLDDGQTLPADLLVTATGLRLALAGKIEVTIDGVGADWPSRWFYRSCMFSNVPNLASVFGYFNASWTLRADNTAQYICRVLEAMDERGADVAVPRLDDDSGLAQVEPFLLSSGYLQRARHLVPKSAARLPWRLNQDYFEDCRDFRDRPVDDGVLQLVPCHSTKDAA